MGENPGFTLREIQGSGPGVSDARSETSSVSSIPMRTDQEAPRPKRLDVRNPEGVKALFDNKQRTLLSPYFNEPVSIAEAATRADALPSTMLQFVRRMNKVGILTHVDDVRRNGRKVRRYSTAADEFFIAIDVAEDLLISPERKFQQLYNEALHTEVVHHHYKVEPLGALVRCLPNGVVEMSGALGEGDWVPGQNGPLILFEWTMLKLNEPDARAFQHELASLTRRYRTLPFGDRPFYFGLHFAPVPDSHPPRFFVNTPIVA
jgi:predicted transcriptional regulator